MSDPVYPASLPRWNVEGYAFQPGKGGRRFEPDTGAAKQRPRTRATPGKFRGSIDCTAAQRLTFWTFWTTDLKQGALPFQMVHPVEGATRRWQFVVGEEPVETLVIPHFVLSCTLELLP